MTKFKVGDKVIRQAKYRKNGWFAGDTPVTVAIVTPHNSIGFEEDPRDDRKWSQSYFDLVSLPTFEVGKTYLVEKTTTGVMDGDKFKVLFITDTGHTVVRWLGQYPHNNEVIWKPNATDKWTISEYIPPPPEEWRALFYVKNGKPEISAVYFSTQIACEEYFRHRETKNQIENNLKDGAFMYAIRTDINAKKEN